MNRFDNIRQIISFEVFKQVEDIHDKLDKKLFGNRNTGCILKNHLLQEIQLFHDLIEIPLNDNSINRFVVGKETLRLLQIYRAVKEGFLSVQLPAFKVFLIRSFKGSND